MSSLVRLGWTTFFQDQIDDERAEPQIARVVQEQRGLCGVAGDFDGWAEVSGRFRHEAGRAADFPAVGDWVGVVAPPGAGRAVFIAVSSAAARCRARRQGARLTSRLSPRTWTPSSWSAR